MNTKHTPGPWHLIDKGDGLFPSVLIGQFGIPYADNSGNYDRCGQITVNGCAPSGPHEMHVANARLIAAAPDLLDALRELYEMRSYILNQANKNGRFTANNRHELAFAAARDAIAKAEGRS